MCYLAAVKILELNKTALLWSVYVSLGGNVTLDDLEAYVSSFKVPVNVTLSNGDYTIYNPPPPSSGVVLDFILGILDGM